MTKKSTEWIEREVDSLVREGLISEQAQDRIRAHTASGIDVCCL